MKERIRLVREKKAYNNARDSLVPPRDRLEPTNTVIQVPTETSATHSLFEVNVRVGRRDRHGPTHTTCSGTHCHCHAEAMAPHCQALTSYEASYSLSEFREWAAAAHTFDETPKETSQSPQHSQLQQELTPTTALGATRTAHVARWPQQRSLLQQPSEQALSQGMNLQSLVSQLRHS